MGSLIATLRKIVRQIVIYRDAGLCTRHFYILKEEVSGDHVHHVFGRSSDPDNWRETAASQLCLCFACHNLYPSLQKKTGDTEQEKILALVSSYPITVILSRRKEY